MTIDVENIHSLVHLLHISTLHGVKLRKKPWKCSQRRLKGDNPVGGLLFYKSKVLVSCTQKCHDPVGHTGIQMLSPIPIAPQNIQKMRDWAQTFGVAVRQMVKAETLPSYPDQREIQLGEPLSFELADFKEQRKKKKKNQPKRKMRYWYWYLQWWRIAWVISGRRDRVWWPGHPIFGTRDSFSPRKIFPVSEEVFALTAELCSINFSLIISLVMEALVDTVIHFFDTELSLLLCFSGVEVKRMEVVIVTSLCYSCKTLKTSWMNDIVRVKKDKLTPYGDQRLQRINAGWNKTKIYDQDIEIGRYKPSGLRNWDKIEVGSRD